MHKTKSDMREAAKRVRYEWRQFTWAVERRAKGVYPAESGEKRAQHDAVIEVLLLHARVLRDFFKNRRVSRPKSTDMLADDFFDPPVKRKAPTFKYLTEKLTKERLDRALAHITYHRLDYEKNKGWNFPAVIEELSEAWKDFLADLPSERRAWFVA